MSRSYSPIYPRYEDRAGKLLDQLSDYSTDPIHYQAAMHGIGVLMGEWLLEEIDDPEAGVYLAFTVEDADFLAAGILEQMESKLGHVPFACFWNQRFSPFDIDDLNVAPIIREFKEPVGARVKYLIVVKSIISGACVVRTNLEHLIEKIMPERIFIVAPVIHEQSEEKLRREFEPEIYNKFEFFYFAKDSERLPDGEIVPGIGGSVYERLGFEGQDDKNRYTPDTVKRRRSMLISR